MQTGTGTIELRQEIVSGSPIAYRRAGTGPALVLLHGFASDSRAWGPQLEGLSSEFSIIAWDAPGAGASPDPPGAFTFGDWADALAGLLDRLAVQGAHVLGISWGGVLAQVFYQRYPGRTRSLVLADTYAGWTGSLGVAAAAGRLESAMADLALPPAEFADRFMPSMFGSTPPHDAVDTLGRLIADRHPVGFRLMATALARADTRHLLPQIRVRTLLLWGDQDVRSSIGVGRQLQAEIPGARLVVIEGAGHVSNLDRPTEFNAAVAEFLRAG
jgi:pimeloyl-ACP methyl ester carboxylesterase